MTLTLTSTEQLDAAAQTFISTIGTRRIFAFYGSMGAGKTTFIAALCKALGVDDTVTSPTFSIVNEYEVAHPTTADFPQGDTIYHFDFYRINRREEIFDMGYEEYFYSGSLCLIEWPELLDDLLPDDAVRVDITALHDGTRKLTWDE